MKTALKRIVFCSVIVCVLWSFGRIRDNTAADDLADCICVNGEQFGKGVQMDDIKERVIPKTKEILDLSAAKEYVIGRLPAIRRIIGTVLSESHEEYSLIYDSLTSESDE